MTRESTESCIHLLEERDAPYSMQEIEEVLANDELFEGEESAKVLVNYLVSDPVSNRQMSMSGSLSPDLTNAISFALNIVFARNDSSRFVSFDRNDSVRFSPDERVLNETMSVAELRYFLQTTQRFDKEQEVIHVNYLDRLRKSIPRHVGVVTGLSCLWMHNSPTSDRVFVLHMKNQESPWV